MSQQLTMFAPLTAPPGAIDDAILDHEFEAEFWPAWQARAKRHNNPKQLARRSFFQARRGTATREAATLAEILAGLTRYAFSNDPTYRPMAATWLNQGRFRDAVDLAADPWGIDAWLAEQPASDALGPGCYPREALDPILLAFGQPETWRGSMEALAGWLRDGLTPDSIARVIAEAVAQFGPRRSLEAFDKRVRALASRL